MRTVATISSDTKQGVLDPEEFHGISEVEIQMHSLNKRTCHKNSRVEVSSALAWDDLTGMRLDSGQVIEARAKEVQYIKDKRVYSKITRKEAQARDWKIIKTRWIDINKGDDANPVYRSRMVGK